MFMAETLLRRTRASSAANVFEVLDSEFRGPEDVVRNQPAYKEKIRTLGLVGRSSLFFSACDTLVKEFSGRLPGDADDLLSLPGVGHYSRDAVLNFGFGRPRYLVDTNTIRLAARFTGRGIDQTKHRSQSARTIIGSFAGPESNMSPDRNFALLDLAATLCTPNRPKCEQCPLNESCYHSTKIRGQAG